TYGGRQGTLDERMQFAEGLTPDAALQTIQASRADPHGAIAQRLAEEGLAAQKAVRGSEDDVFKVLHAQAETALIKRKGIDAPGADLRDWFANVANFHSFGFVEDAREYQIQHEMAAMLQRRATEQGTPLPQDLMNELHLEGLAGTSRTRFNRVFR